MPTKNATKKSKPVKSILCNDKYGIYYGTVLSYDPVTRVASVEGCRHVCAWYGRSGGITSLAVHGLCGPKKDQSRVGAPVAGASTLTGIVNVFPCSTEASDSLDAAKVS